MVLDRSASSGICDVFALVPVVLLRRGTFTSILLCYGF